MINNLHYQLAIDTLEPGSELDRLVREQYDDMRGLQGHGEYLGGNGQTQWHHTDARDMSGLGEDNTDDMDHEERALLQAEVQSHQESIESNGAYIVRNLSRWEGGAYDGDKAKDASRARTRELIGLGNAKEAGKRSKAQTRRKNSPEAIAARKAKRLAKMAARHA